MLWVALIVSWVLVPDVPSELPHPTWRTLLPTCHLDISAPSDSDNDEGVFPPRAIATASIPELQDACCPMLPSNRPSSNHTAIRAPPV